MKFFLLPAIFALTSSLSYASTSSSDDVLSVPITPDLKNHKPLIANEVPSLEDSAQSQGERQYIHNINRNEMIKNWKVDFGWNSESYIGKYQHVNGDRGMFLKFEKELPNAKTALDTMKVYMERYQCDKNSLKLYSETYVSADTLIHKDKPKDPSNTMRIYISKEKPGDGYTVIFVMGSVSDSDFKLVLEDFFLKIEQRVHGQMKEIDSDDIITKKDKDIQGSTSSKNK